MTITVPEPLFSAMEVSRLSPHARLLLVDVIRRLHQAYPLYEGAVSARRPIRVVWRDGRLGMTRPRFAAARRELLGAGLLRHTDPPSRDWYVFDGLACEKHN